MDEVDLGFNGKLKIFYCSNKSPVKIKEFSRQQGQKFLRRKKNVIYKSILRVIRFFTCGQIFLVFHISKICEEELITFGPATLREWAEKRKRNTRKNERTRKNIV